MKLSQRQVWVITIGCFLSYFLFGFIDNLKGTTIPAILKDVGFNYSKGGTIIFSEYTGFFLATFFAGLLADLLGKKFSLVLAGLCLILGVIGYASSSHLAMFVAFIFLIGLGLGSLELSGSNIISGIHEQHKGRYMNLLNAFYGIGSIITPILAGHFLNIGLSFRTIYRYSLFVIVPITVYFIVMRYPRDTAPDEAEKKIDFKDLIQIISQKDVLLMYVVIFAYVAAEIGMATWMVEFFQQERHVSVVASSLYLSIHFAGMTIGRLLGSFFVDKAGHLKSLLIFSLLAVLCISQGIFGPPSIAIVLAFTGFCFSIIFPTATAVVSGIPAKSSGTMLGMFFACGGLGGMIGPWLIGFINDLLGLKIGMSVNILFCIIIVFSLITLLRQKHCS